jgi:hypothetical protein
VGKDGAIELCFRLLSSGRQLGEVIEELALVPARTGVSEPRGTGAGPAGPAANDVPATEPPNRPTPDYRGAIAPMFPSLTELLGARARQANPDHASEGGALRLVLQAEAALAAGPPAAVLEDAWVKPAASRGSDADAGARELPEGGSPRRGRVRRLGVLLILGGILILAPVVVEQGLRLAHRAPPVAGQPVARIGNGAPAAVGRVAVRAHPVAAESTPPPRMVAAAAVGPPPAEARQAKPGDVLLPASPAAAREAAPAVLPVAIMPGDPPHAAQLATAARASPVRSAVLRQAAPTAAKQPDAPRLSPNEAELTVAQGDARLATGDVTAARLFYRRAADGGDGTAALRLGETFDPAFLAQAGLGRVAGDPQQAAHWYRRAHELGNHDADLLLKSVAAVR